MRMLLVFLILASLVILPFLIWGDALTEMFSQQGSIAWMQQYGQWAWLAGISLLIADLFLPIPGTVVMSALGYIYGPLWGGLLASLGSFLSGLLAYFLCRKLGEGAALWLLGKKDYRRGKTLFANVGGWLVALSRWLPIFPEVVACMAGLARMPWLSFGLALLCGTLPLAFTFAYIGYAGLTAPCLAVGLSAGLPAVLWLVTQYFFRKAMRQAA